MERTTSFSLAQEILDLGDALSKEDPGDMAYKKGLRKAIFLIEEDRAKTIDKAIQTIKSIRSKVEYIEDMSLGEVYQKLNRLKETL